MYYELLKDSLIYNNECRFNNDGKIIGGNSTDRALLKYANIDNSKKVIYKETFDSSKKYSLVTLNNDITYIKMETLFNRFRRDRNIK